MLGNVPNGASFTARQASGFAILGSAWEPGPRSQAAALGLAEKPAFECSRSGRTGGRGPTFKKILSGLLTFDIYVYIFVYIAARCCGRKNKRGPLWIIKNLDGVRFAAAIFFLMKLIYM